MSPPEQFKPLTDEEVKELTIPPHVDMQKDPEGTKKKYTSGEQEPSSEEVAEIKNELKKMESVGVKILDEEEDEPRPEDFPFLNSN